MIHSIRKVFFYALFFVLFAFSQAQANVEKFEIIANPTKVRPWEAIDITIKALDKNNNVVENYKGEIFIFSNKDPKAQLPKAQEGNMYQFKETDKGVVTFEDSAIFTKVGKMDIQVVDSTNDAIQGMVEIEVVEWTPQQQKENITIDYPENNNKISQDKFQVNGKTVANHLVKIQVDKKQTFEGISNKEWIYSIEVSWLSNGKHSLVATVHDADGNVIGTSKETIIEIDASAPFFKSIRTIPEKQVEAWKDLTIEVNASADLMSVTVLLNDIALELKEWKKWVYTAKTKAPNTPGTYSLDVVLRNEFWKETKKPKAASITVFKQETFANTWAYINCDDLKKELEIKNIKVTKLKTKSVLTWDHNEKASSYNVYKKSAENGELIFIENVTEPKVEINIEGDKVVFEDFVIKAVLQNESCDIEGNEAVATKVQTGSPEMILIVLSLFLSLILLGGYFRFKRI